MRITRTGASKILNSKAEYSRCELPRLVAAKAEEEINLGDRQEEMEDEVFEKEDGTEINNLSEKEMRRRRRKEKLKDLINWGIPDELEIEAGETVEALIDLLEDEEVERRIRRQWNR